MADSIMLATARAYGATLWSQDSDFENISEVRYIAQERGAALLLVEMTEAEITSKTP